MSYQIMLHPGAAKFLEKLEERAKNHIKDAVRQLKQSPFQGRPGADIKKLKGTKGRHDLFRLRVGGYRVIYAVENETVWVTEIFSRGRGY
ncbi:MAG: type II toxin-antitoxin system RelE/ParE family toxin [Methanobacteriota archaeon]